MALARHKAEGRCNRHWKRNHLFNSITGSHRRLLCHWCHLESWGSFTEQAVYLTEVSTHANLQRSDAISPFIGEWSEKTLTRHLWGCLHLVVINTYIVREISFVTCPPQPPTLSLGADLGWLIRDSDTGSIKLSPLPWQEQGAQWWPTMLSNYSVMEYWNLPNTINTLDTRDGK